GVMDLVKFLAGGRDQFGGGVLVEQLPAGHGDSGVFEDAAGAVELVEIVAGCGELLGRRVIIQLLPAGHGGSGVFEDVAGFMELVEVVAFGDDVGGGGVAVEFEPVGEQVSGLKGAYALSVRPLGLDEEAAHADGLSVADIADLFAGGGVGIEPAVGCG